MDDRLFADGRYDCGRAPESREKEALEGVPIVGFDNKEEDVFRVRAISSNDFDAFSF